MSCTPQGWSLSKGVSPAQLSPPPQEVGSWWSPWVVWSSLFSLSQYNSPSLLATLPNSSLRGTPWNTRYFALILFMPKTEGKESMTQCSVIFVTMGKAVLLAVSQTPGLAACCTERGCPGQKKIDLFSSILVFFVARLPLHTALYPALPLLPHRRGCSAQMWGNCSNTWDMRVTPRGLQKVLEPCKPGCPEGETGVCRSGRLGKPPAEGCCAGEVRGWRFAVGRWQLLVGSWPWNIPAPSWGSCWETWTAGVRAGACGSSEVLVKVGEGAPALYSLFFVYLFVFCFLQVEMEIIKVNLTRVLDVFLCV